MKKKGRKKGKGRGVICGWTGGIFPNKNGRYVGASSLPKAKVG